MSTGLRAADLPMWAIVSDARVRAGLSRVDLARAARLKESTLEKIERALVLPPTPVLDRLMQTCERAMRDRIDPHGLDDDAELEEFRLSLSLEQRLTVMRLMSEIDPVLDRPD